MHDGTAVWSGGESRSPIDLWLIPGFGDSHLCFSDVFDQPIAARARIHVWDLPGHGASPPQAEGLTVAHAACLLRDLITQVSGDRPVLLVAHALGSVIAIVTAQLLGAPPKLLVNVAGELAPADTGECDGEAEYSSPVAFVEKLRQETVAAALTDSTLRHYWRSLQLADSPTLWSLHRSLLAYRSAGDAFLRLPCPTTYYWDPTSAPQRTQHLLARHRPAQRKLAGLGHWPMVKAPAVFYRLLEEDMDRYLVPAR